MNTPSDIDLIDRLVQNAAKQLLLLEKLQARLDRLTERVTGLEDDAVRCHERLQGLEDG